MAALPVFETIKIAWNKVGGTKLTFFTSFVTVFLVITLLTISYNLSSAHEHRLLAFLLMCIRLVVETLLTSSVFYMGIQRAFNQPVRFAMLGYAFQSDLWGRVIALLFLRWLILLLVALPLFLPSIVKSLFVNESFVTSAVFQIMSAFIYVMDFLIIIYLHVRMSLALAFVLNKKANAWQAIKLSFQAARGNVWRLLGLIFMNWLIILVSLIPLGIGLIWSVPYAFISYGVIYQKLGCADNQVVAA